MKKGKLAEHVVVGMLLAFAGGYVDAYTYLTRGGVFCYAQTANLLLLSISMVRGGGEVWRFLATGGAFVVGILFARGMRHWNESRNVEYYRIAILVLMIGVLFAVGSLPRTVNDLWVTTSVAFISAVQFSSFRLLDGNPYATTMCTGNLRVAAESLYEAVFLKKKGAWERSAKYFAVILLFCAGAASSALGAGAYAGRSVWFAAIPLTAVAIILCFDAFRRSNVREEKGEL